MGPVSHRIIFWLIIGGIAGALAGRIVDGGGFGIVVEIIVGIVGAFIGGWLEARSVSTWVAASSVR